jgi:hypothetical protein
MRRRRGWRSPWRRIDSGARVVDAMRTRLNPTRRRARAVGTTLGMVPRQHANNRINAPGLDSLPRPPRRHRCRQDQSGVSFRAGFGDVVGVQCYPVNVDDTDCGDNLRLAARWRRSPMPQCSADWGGSHAVHARIGTVHRARVQPARYRRTRSFERWTPCRMHAPRFPGRKPPNANGPDVGRGSLSRGPAGFLASPAGWFAGLRGGDGRRAWQSWPRARLGISSDLKPRWPGPASAFHRADDGDSSAWSTRLACDAFEHQPADRRRQADCSTCWVPPGLRPSGKSPIRSRRPHYVSRGSTPARSAIYVLLRRHTYRSESACLLLGGPRPEDRDHGAKDVFASKPSVIALVTRMGSGMWRITFTGASAVNAPTYASPMGQRGYTRDSIGATGDISDLRRSTESSSASARRPRGHHRP